MQPYRRSLTLCAIWPYAARGRAVAHAVRRCRVPTGQPGPHVNPDAIPYAHHAHVDGTPDVSSALRTPPCGRHAEAMATRGASPGGVLIKHTEFPRRYLNGTSTAGTTTSLPRWHGCSNRGRPKRPPPPRPPCYTSQNALTSPPLKGGYATSVATSAATPHDPVATGSHACTHLQRWRVQHRLGGN